MIVPRLPGTMPQLNISNTTFQQTPCDQCLTRMNAISVHLVDVGRFSSHIKCIGRILLHSERQFKRLNSSIQSLIHPPCPVFCIHTGEQVELSALSGRCNLWMLNILDQLTEFLVL